MKWRHLGHLQLFSRVVAVMAEMEVSLQDDILRQAPGFVLYHTRKNVFLPPSRKEEMNRKEKKGEEMRRKEEKGVPDRGNTKQPVGETILRK